MCRVRAFGRVRARALREGEEGRRFGEGGEVFMHLKSQKTGLTIG